MNYTQESKLFDDRQLALFPGKRWCFTTNHSKGGHLMSFV